MIFSNQARVLDIDPEEAALYPDSDGEPMAENTLKWEWIATIKHGLDALFLDDPDVVIAGDLLWYPVQGEPTVRTAPDAMVAFGRPKGYRGSYMQWHEDGIAPQVVFEVLSPGNRAGEMKRKLEFYEFHGVDEYYIYDPEPLSASLSGYHRSGDRLEPIPEMEGWISPRLGVRFGLSGSDLVLVGPDRRPFLSFEDATRKLESLDRRNRALSDLVDETARRRRAPAIGGRAPAARRRTTSRRSRPPARRGRPPARGPTREGRAARGQAEGAGDRSGGVNPGRSMTDPSATAAQSRSPVRPISGVVACAGRRDGRGLDGGRNAMAVSKNPKEIPAITPEQIEALRRQVVELQRVSSLGVLASSVCHELNNALTPVLNYAKLGLRNPDPEFRRKAFEKILDGAQRATVIAGGVLGLSRPQTDRRDPADLVRLTEEVILLAGKELQKGRVHVEFRAEGRPFAKVNPAQIQQVLLNLIINARQAMPEGGTLRVRVGADPSGRTSEISVADDGVGIAPEDLRRIFEPFFTTKLGPDSSGHGGTGLGLSVCRDIVESHKGRLRAESRPGRGTTFTLRLPSCPIPVSKQGAA